MGDEVYIGLLTGAPGNAFVNGTNFSGIAIIPSIIEYNGVKYRVTRTTFRCFYQCWNLTELYLPTTLEFLSRDTFYNTGLKEVVIPYSVREIGIAGLYNNENTIIKFQKGSLLTKIGNETFGGSRSKRYIIPAGVTSIGSRLFRYSSTNNSLYICSSEDFSNITDLYYEANANGWKFYVTPSYKGSTFGGSPVLPITDPYICENYDFPNEKIIIKTCISSLPINFKYFELYVFIYL